MSDRATNHECAVNSSTRRRCWCPFRSVLTPVVLLASVACGPERGSAGRTLPTVTDSAGVRVVRNGRGSDTLRATEWIIRETASFGTDAETSTYPVLGRPIDATRAPDGSVIVLDQLARDVKVYDAEGRFSHRIGRPGEGPGEFGRAGSLWSILMTGDTVLVPDPLLGRVSRFRVDGEVLDAIELPGALVGLRWERQPTGAFLVQTSSSFLDEAGVSRSRARLLRFEQGGAGPDTVHAQDPELNHWGSREVLDYPMLVTAPVWSVLDSGDLVLGRTDRTTLDVLGPTGDLRMRVSHPAWRARPISDRVARTLSDRFRSYRESLGPSRDPRRKSTHLGQGIAHTYTGVFEGPEGTLWVQRPLSPADLPGEFLNRSRPDGLGSGTWDVLNAGGEALGVVEFPDTVRVLDTGDDWLLGLTEDELGVRTVRMYAIERAGSSG